jgi:hypothetical protein
MSAWKESAELVRQNFKPGLGIGLPGEPIEIMQNWALGSVAWHVAHDDLLFGIH